MFDSPKHASNACAPLPAADRFQPLSLVPLPEIRRATMLSAFRLGGPLSDLSGQIPFADEIEALIEEICGGRWRIGKRTARALALIFDRVRPARMLEFGSGASTVVFAALAKHATHDAHIVSIEENSQYAAKTRDWLADFDLSAYATIVTAPVIRRALGSWRGYAYQPDTSTLVGLLGPSRAELVFIDGPASWMTSRADCRYGTLLTAREWLADQAIFIADDVFRAREEAILRRWDQLAGIHVHGIVPVGRGLGVGEVAHANGNETATRPRGTSNEITSAVSQNGPSIP